MMDDRLPARSDGPLSFYRLGRWPQQPAPSYGRSPMSKPPSELLQYVQLVLRSWRLLALLTVLGGIAGFVYMLYQPPRYRSTAVIEIQGVNESFMGLDRADPQGGAGNYGSNAANMLTQIRLITSPSLIGRTLRRMKSDQSHVIPPRPDRYTPLRQLLRIGTKTSPDEAVRLAANSVTARQVNGTRLIEITVESSIPETAAVFLNALTDQYIDETQETRSRGVVSTASWINNQITELQEKVKTAEVAFQQFVAANGTTFAAPLDTLAESRIHQLREQAMSAQSDRVAKQLRYQATLSGNTDSMSEFLDDGVLQSLAGEKTRLQTQINELTAKLTPQHQKVRAAQQQLDDVESRIRGRKASIQARLKQDFETSRRNESLAEGAYQLQARTAVAEGGKTNVYQSLKHDVDAAREALNAMLQQQRQTSTATALPTNYIRVIDPAGPADLAVSPNTPALVGWGLVSGFMIAIVWAFSKDKIQAKIHTPGVIGDILDLPELAVVPSAFARPMLKRGVSIVGARPLLTDGVELASHYQQSTLLAESFRSAMVSIAFGDGRSEAPKVIVVTSPGKGEGKTTVTSNLAITMAQAGRRVVLVDADLRAPRMHTVFGLTNTIGLAGYVSAEKELPLSEVVQATKYPMLSVVTAGKMPENIASVLYSGRLPSLIKLLSEEFDSVIIDTPPSLGFVDTRIFARMSQGVVLVVRVGVTQESAIRAACNQLAVDGAPLLGTILNDWKPTALESKSYNTVYNYYTPGE